MGVLIILKSGKEINNTSETVTPQDVFKHMSINPGSCISVGDNNEGGFILCSEIAAVIKTK